MSQTDDYVEPQAAEPVKTYATDPNSMPLLTVEAMLTTIDNPHDPFESFPRWYQWDVANGYNSSAFLARILVDGDGLSEADENIAIEMAIDEIVRENVSGMFKKVTRKIEVTQSI